MHWGTSLVVPRLNFVHLGHECDKNAAQSPGFSAIPLDLADASQEKASQMPGQPLISFFSWLLAS